MTEIKLNIPLPIEVKERKVRKFSINNKGVPVFGFEDGIEVPEEVVVSDAPELVNDKGEVSHKALINVKKEDKTIVDKSIDSDAEIKIVDNYVKDINKVKEINSAAGVDIEEVTKTDPLIFPKVEESIQQNTIDEIIKDTELVKHTVKKNTDAAINTITEKELKESEFDGNDGGENSEVEKANIQRNLSDKRNVTEDNFGNDYFFNSIFGNIESSLTAYDMTIADKKELWDDDFIRQTLEATYGVENARKEFDKSYDKAIKSYTEMHKIARNAYAAADYDKKTAYTGNKYLDIINAETEAARVGVEKLYNQLDARSVSLGITDAYALGQMSINGELSTADYSTVAEVALSQYKDEDGILRKVNANDTRRLEEEGKVFAIKTDSLYGDKEARGSSYMEVVSQGERLKPGYEMVPVYETSDDYFLAHTLRRMRKPELEGVADWASVIPATFYNLGMQLAGSVTAMAQAVYAGGTEIASWGGVGDGGTDSMRYWSNNFKKYTPGRTYEQVNNMWGYESIVTGTIDAAAQILFAMALGAPFKKSPKFQQGLVRSTLTVYGAGSAYDEALDQGFSPAEAATYFASTFVGLWYVNSLSSWITDRTDQKALYGKMKKLIKEKMPSVIAAEKAAGGGKEGLRAVSRKWMEIGSKWGEKLPQFAKDGLTEGLEESSEEIAQEISRQVHNLYYWASGNELDEENGFRKMNDVGYWGDLANNTLFSGTIGGLSGLTSGGGKAMLNRKASDVKDYSTFNDVIMQGKDQHLLKVLREMKESGGLGAEDIDVRSNKDNIKYVKKGDDFSISNWNYSLLLTDYVTTKKTMGDSAKLKLSISNSEVDIDVAKVAKETLDAAFVLYAENDMSYDDFLKIQKTSLKEFNAERKKINKDTKDLSDSDFTKLVEYNNTLSDIKNGRRHQYEWFRMVTSDDNIFGKKDNRVSSLQDEKFDDLAYKFFNAVMTVSENENDELNKKLISIAEVDGVEITGDIKVLTNAIKEFKSKNLITLEQFTKAESALTSNILNSQEYLNLKKNADDDLLKFIKKHQVRIVADLTNEIDNYQKQIDDYNSLEDKSKSTITIDLFETQLSDAKKKLNIINSIDGKLNVFHNIFNLNISKDIKNGFIVANELNYSALSDGAMEFIFDSIINKEDFVNDSDYYSKINNSLELTDPSYKTTADDRTIYEHKTGAKDVRGLSNLKSKFEDLYNDLYSIEIVDKAKLEQEKITGTGFLNKILELSSDGSINEGERSLSGSMISYIDFLKENVQVFGEGTDNAKELLKINLDSVDDIHSSLHIQNRFLSLMQNHMRTINSINRYIKGVNDGSITITNKTVKDTALNRFLDRNKGLNNTVKFTKWIFAPMKLQGIQVSPDIKIDYKGIESDTAYSNVLDKQIMLLKEELATTKDVDKKNKIQNKINELDKMIEKDRILKDSILDYDRMEFLKSRLSKKIITKDEQVELDSYIERDRQLSKPTKELINTLMLNESKEVRDLKKIVNKLRSEVESLDDSINEIYNNEEFDAEFVNRTLAELKIKRELFSKSNAELIIAEDSVKKNAIAQFEKLTKESAEFTARINDFSLDIDERKKLSEVGDPLFNFILDRLNKEFYNNDSGNSEITPFLELSKKVFANENLTIADRSFFTSAFYEVLKQQAGEYEKMGKGASYNDELKSTITKNLSDLKGLLNNVNFECLN